MKKANRKLLELEKLAKDPDFDGVLKFAYRVAGRDVKELGLGNTEVTRYRIPYDPKKGVYDTNKLKSALRRVKEFNEMPTSSKSGIMKLYVQDTINFNKAFGTNFTWQELRQFTKKSNWDDLKKEKGSAVLQAAIKDYMRKMPTPEDIKTANETHKTKTTESSVAEDWMQHLIKNGLQADMLYKGTGEFVPIEDNESPFID